MLDGNPGDYSCQRDAADVPVPASLQATIAARIDRLRPIAKRTLTAAAVIGSRFDTDLLACLVDDVEVADLIAAELIDQVAFTVAANAVDSESSSGASAMRCELGSVSSAPRYSGRNVTQQE